MYPDKTKKLNVRRSGMTLVELVVGSLIAAITVLAIGFFLSDSHRSFNETYSKGLSDAAQDETVIRTAFCKVIRTASTTTTGSVGPDGEWLEVPIYSTPGLSNPDQYALFYVSENQLLLLKKATLKPDRHSQRKFSAITFTAFTSA